jgi:zinc transport system substrate-binding protein
LKRLQFASRSLLVLIIMSLLVAFPACSGQQASEKLKVVTTTSLLEYIVERVGGEKVQVVNIIPPAQCPGHFDVKPSDVQLLSDAQLFLLHGWQGEMFNTRLINSANNPSLQVVPLNIEGNWMTPAVQAQAVDNITVTLSELDPDNAGYYQSNAELYQSVIAAKGAELKAKLEAANVDQYNVICGDMIKGLIVWTGVNVVASYPRPEDLTPQKMQELIDLGKQHEVAIVIDNLQSGKADAGVQMAQEIGAVQVTLSNFPGGFANTETWEKAIEKDVELLLEAIAKYQEQNP